MSEFPMVTFMAHGEEHTIPAATLAKIGEYARKKAASAANDAGTEHESLSRAREIGEAMWEAILGLGCSESSTENDEMGEAGRAAKAWSDYMHDEFQKHLAKRSADGPGDAWPWCAPCNSYHAPGAESCRAGHDVSPDILRGRHVRYECPFVGCGWTSDYEAGASPDYIERSLEHHFDEAHGLVKRSAPSAGAALEHADLEAIRDLLRYLGTGMTVPGGRDEKMDYGTYRRVWEAGREALSNLERSYRSAHADGYDDGSTRSTKRPDGTWEVAPSTSQGDTDA